MKAILQILRRRIPALFAALIFFACIASAQAQAGLKPFVDCVERVYNSDGSASGNYRIYFGYFNTDTINREIPPNNPNNFFSPYPNVPSAPGNFFPGVHDFESASADNRRSAGNESANRQQRLPCRQCR